MASGASAPPPASLSSSTVGRRREAWLPGPACLADRTGSDHRPSEVLILFLPASCSLSQGLHPPLRLLQRAHGRHRFPESAGGPGRVWFPARVPSPAPRPWGSPLPSLALTSSPINGALGQVLKHRSRLAALPFSWRPDGTQGHASMCPAGDNPEEGAAGFGRPDSVFTGDALVARTVLHCLYQSDVPLSNSYHTSSPWLGS